MSLGNVGRLYRGVGVADDHSGPDHPARSSPMRSAKAGARHLPMAIGVALGDFTAMTFSMLGLGALLATSATIFTILKWVGAAYMIWLGIKLWRAGGRCRPSRKRDGCLHGARCWAMPGS